MADCKDCKIVWDETETPGFQYNQSIQHCEACTRAHEIAAERDALKTRLEDFKFISEVHEGTIAGCEDANKSLRSERDELRDVMEEISATRQETLDGAAKLWLEQCIIKARMVLKEHIPYGQLGLDVSRKNLILTIGEITAERDELRKVVDTMLAALEEARDMLRSCRQEAPIDRDYAKAWKAGVKQIEAAISAAQALKKEQ